MADELRTPLFGATFDAPEDRAAPAAGAGDWRADRRAGDCRRLSLEPTADGCGGGDGRRAPLELVSMRHERQGDTLVVSGLVRNPHNGQPVSGLSAVAFTFDRQGTFLASGRASARLSPARQRATSRRFRSRCRNRPACGRYRVSFRTEDGVVPHVDRRDRHGWRRRRGREELTMLDAAGRAGEDMTIIARRFVGWPRQWRPPGRCSRRSNSRRRRARTATDSASARAWS